MMTNAKLTWMIRQAKAEDAASLPEIELSAVKEFLVEPDLHFIVDMPVF